MEDKKLYILEYPLVTMRVDEPFTFVTLLLRPAEVGEDGKETVEAVAREFKFASSALKSMLTTEPHNPGTESVNEYYLQTIAKTLMILLQEVYDVSRNDVDRITQFLTNHVHNYFMDANRQLWGKKDFEIRLSDIRSVLQSSDTE